MKFEQRSRTLQSNSENAPLKKANQTESIFLADIEESCKTKSSGKHPRFYRLPKVLEILQISRAKFLKMVKEGAAPPPVKMSRCSLYVVEEIDKFAVAILEASRSKAPFDIDLLVSEIGKTNGKAKK